MLGGMRFALVFVLVLAVLGAMTFGIGPTYSLPAKKHTCMVRCAHI